MPNKQLLQSSGDGTAVPRGYVGEIITSSIEVSAAASNAGITVGSVLLSSGVWRIEALSSYTNSSGILTAGLVQGLITTNSSLNPTGGFLDIDSGGYQTALIFSASNQPKGNCGNSVMVTISSNITYYNRVAWTTTGGGSIGIKGYIRATRIA